MTRLPAIGIAATLVALALSSPLSAYSRQTVTKPGVSKGKAKPITAAEARKRCRAVMRQIADADAAHIIRSGTHDFTTDVAVLEREAGRKFQGTCPDHGAYRIEINDDGTFTVHCSVKAHDVTAKGKTGFSPERDHE